MGESMLKNVEELKELISWSRKNGVSLLRIGEVEVTISPEPSVLAPRVAKEYVHPPAREQLLQELAEFGG